MAFTLNKAQLIGVLGKDAETTFSKSSNKPITKFSVATTHGKKDKDGSWEDITTWHAVTAFNLNDFLIDSLKKGQKVYVEGRIDYQVYEKDGEKKYFTSIIAGFDGIIPLTKREAQGQQTEDNNYQSSQLQIDDQSLPF